MHYCILYVFKGLGCSKIMWSCSKMWLRGPPLLSNTWVAIRSLALLLWSLHSICYSVHV